MQINIFGEKIRIFQYCLLFLVALMAYSMPLGAYAQDTKRLDSDVDGLSDFVEIDKYKTNPGMYDTDSDGVGDSQEILTDKTNPLDANSSILKDAERSAMRLINTEDPLIWYVSRVAGIASFIMFTLVVSMGLLMTSKILLKVPFLKSPDALKMHSFNATIVAFGLMLIHFLSLMFDSYIKLTPLEILVPFVVERDLTSALGFNFRIPIGIGVIAFYISILLIVTSQFRRKLPSMKIWRTIHFSSFLFYVLFVVHGITAGSDTKELWMQLIYAWSIIQVSSLILLRIFGKKYFLSSIKKVTNASAVATTAANTLSPNLETAK